MNNNPTRNPRTITANIEVTINTDASYQMINSNLFYERILNNDTETLNLCANVVQPVSVSVRGVTVGGSAQNESRRIS